VEPLRVIPAPPQEGVRVQVLRIELFADHLTLHAVVESDLKEIVEPFWEDDQADMFGIVDDRGSGYERGGAGGSGSPGEHVWTWDIDFYPAVPEGVRTLTVTHVAGSVELRL
jgi:hypothetical protein